MKGIKIQDMCKEKQKWMRIFTEQGDLLFEGMTFSDKPCGAGVVYFSNGSIYQEGIFGIKGLTVGREYYPNGKLRFEGIYTVNHGYGPNYPENGRFFDEEGQCLADGKITYKISGLGYPLEAIGSQMGKVVQENHPKISWLMWEDLNR